MKVNITFKQYPLISKFIYKMGIRKEIKEIVKEAATVPLEEQAVAKGVMAVDLIMIIIENAWKAEEEFNKLLCFLTGKTSEEVDEMGIGEIMETLKSIEVEEGLLESFF